MQTQQQGNRQIQRLTDTAIETLSAQIEEISKSCAIEQVQALPTLQQSVTLARGIQQLREVLNEQVMREVFMPLMGSRLGFRTDADREPPEKRYSPATVRECLIEALIHGVRPVGNEMNIIANNFYQTLEAYERKVSELPDVYEFDARPGAVRMLESGDALVEYRATWLDGVSNVHSYECVYTKTKSETGTDEVRDERIPVKVNKGMGYDAILGKARRKFLARLHRKLTGVRAPDGDVSDAIETQGVTVSSEAVPPKNNQSQADKLAAEAAARREKRGASPSQPPKQESTPMREMGDDSIT